MPTTTEIPWPGNHPDRKYQHFTMADRIGNIGFIGLGLMGLPMVQNLIKKTPESTQFFIYDIVDDALTKFCDEHTTRVTAMKSSSDVAEQAVGR